MEHAWLESSFDDLAALRRRQIPAPWIPTIENALDTSCFDDWDDLEDRTAQHYPRLTLKEEALFEGLTSLSS